MCGICGAFNYQNEERLDPESIRAMDGRLRHRGPDEKGSYASGDFAMSIRRLSVIDPVSGHQPIHNENKKVWTVCNGEIYNFAELKRDLEKKGHRFYTKSDTEVIVHLYEEEGIEFIRRLNGMFAIALWDESARTLYLIRDRLGIKPLFYHLNGESLIFASELPALAAFHSFRKELDPLALAQYLAFDYVPAPRAVYKNTYKVQAGHYLRIEAGTIKDSTYWDIHYHPKIVKSEDEYIDELDALLHRSVKRRLLSDVPLGVFLSGGIDSSLIVAIMARLSNAAVKAFSIAFDDPSFDEADWARRAARYIGVELHQERLSMETMLSLLPEIAKSADDPLGDGSFVPTFLLCRSTRKRVTVSLSGDGGDELFMGYPTYQAYQLARFYEKIPGLARRGLIKPLVDKLPTSFDNISLDFKIKKFISGIGYDPFRRNYVWLGTFVPPEILGILNPDLAREIDPDQIYQPIDDYLQRTDAEADLEKILYLDMKLYLQDNMLVKIDRASMANSLEARVPYLDHEVVEFFCRVPLDLKFKRLRLKKLFKKLALRYLPPEIVHRPKKGFGMPIAKWLLTDSTDRIKDKIRACPYYNQKNVDILINEHSRRQRDHRKKLWNLYCGTFS